MADQKDIELTYSLAPRLRRNIRSVTARLIPKHLTSSDFRLAFTLGISPNRVCFERELLDHFRLVFEKRSQAASGGE